MCGGECVVGARREAELSTHTHTHTTRTDQNTNSNPPSSPRGAGTTKCFSFGLFQPDVQIKLQFYSFVKRHTERFTTSVSIL